MRKNTFALSDLSKFTKKEGSCLVWTKTKPATTTGYATMSIGGINISMHRRVYELSNGPLSSGEVVMHKCDNRLCVNPKHLIKGTLGDNNRDRSSKGRNCCGEASHLSKLTEDVVRAIHDEEGSYRSLAKKYGLNKGTIKQIKTEATWRHLWK